MQMKKLSLAIFAYLTMTLLNYYDLIGWVICIATVLNFEGGKSNSHDIKLFVGQINNSCTYKILKA